MSRVEASFFSDNTQNRAPLSGDNTPFVAESLKSFRDINKQSTSVLNEFRGKHGDLILVGVEDAQRKTAAVESPVRVRDNSDGSSISLERQGDGREHPIKIVHADGSSTEYDYDQSGKLKGVVEFDTSGKQFSHYEAGDGSRGAWVRVGDQPAQLPAVIYGTLTVDDQGNHSFRERDGSTFVRTADGSMFKTNIFGVVVFEDRVTEQEKRSATNTGKDTNDPPEAVEQVRSQDKSQPNADFVDAINRESMEPHPDKAEVIRMIEKAFHDNPELQKRLRDPTTTDDKQFAERFEAAAHRCFPTAQDYGRYIEPLITKGELPLEAQSELYSNDLRGFLKDVVASTFAEKIRLLHEKKYQDTVLGALSAAERKVALFAAAQNSMRTEDELRAAIILDGTDSSEAADILLQLTPEQLDRVKKEYARKYGEWSAVRRLETGRR